MFIVLYNYYKNNNNYKKLSKIKTLKIYALKLYSICNLSRISKIFSEYISKKLKSETQQFYHKNAFNISIFKLLI